MALVQCAGADVLRGEIHLPLRGAWWANLRLDTPNAPARLQQVTIAAAGGLQLTGTVIKAGAFLDSSYVHVVGGAAGTGVLVGPFAYQNAVLGDPLNAILSAARETMSSTVSTALTRMQLGAWTVTQKHAARLLDELCFVAGAGVNWRALADGTIWMGAENWPSQSLPQGADVVNAHPVNPWFEIACDTPSLLPGVNLSDIGNFNVAGVDHWIDAERVRTWAWTAS